jgi:hypothetical protein
VTKVPVNAVTVHVGTGTNMPNLPRPENSSAKILCPLIPQRTIMSNTSYRRAIPCSCGG